MVRDVLAITATIVILAVGTAFAFRDGVLFGQTITGPPIVAPKPAAKERPAARGGRDGEGSGQAGRNVAPTPGGACASQPRRGAVQCRTMKFGWMTLSLSPTPGEYLASVHQQLDQGVFAEAMGFDYLWLTEHN